MERLTKIQEDGTIYYKNDNISFGDCLRKLYRLENLEEEIKIPLDIVVNIIIKKIKKIYIILNDKCENKIVECNKLSLRNKTILSRNSHLESKTYYYNISDFNKRWFVTREDAEKRLDELKKERIVRNG